MNKLYPFKFRPIYKEKIWGGNKFQTILQRNDAPDSGCGESWEISACGNDISIVENGNLKGLKLTNLITTYKADLLGNTVFEKFGTDFPLLIKFIDANDALSVQVHPDDTLAKERHNSFGKTEMWYVLQADADSSLIMGFSKPTTKQQYLDNLSKTNKSDFIKSLNDVIVNQGDTFFIPSGRIHAIGANILVAEIQQTSDVTYRIYDWDRTDDKGNPRELHTELAVDAIDYSWQENYRTLYDKTKNSTNKLIHCEYFITNILCFDKPIYKEFSTVDSFVIYICVEGNCKLEYTENEYVSLKKGESVLVPACVKKLTLIPEIETKLMEAYIE